MLALWFQIIILALSYCCSSSVVMAVDAAFVNQNRHHHSHNIIVYHQQQLDYRLMHPPTIQQQPFSSSTSLQVNSLRDIMDHSDTPSPKSKSNPMRNTSSDMTSSSEQRKHQTLTMKLQNLSTQEIKRELEHIHDISTVALRGKSQLVKALVDARLLTHENGNNDVSQSEESSIIGEGPSSTRSLFESDSSNSASSDGVGRNNNSVSNTINMDQGPDIKTMGVSEIKRELQLYGVVATDAFLGKRDLEEALMRERQIRTPIISSNRSQIGDIRNYKHEESSINTSSRVNDVISGGVMGNYVNKKQSSYSGATTNHHHAATATRLNMSPSSDDNNLQSSSNNNNNDYIYDGKGRKTSSNNNNKDANRAKLRQLQIAFEFERVQSSLPDPTDIQYELETSFGISTKYFLGIKEMAYALAVSRVDDATERQRLGLSRRRRDSDGCLVGEDGMPLPKNADNNDECLTEEDLLPSPEELIAMEYENLQPWDELSLSEELENQYGIPAKHFMGKKEMAYALAVERVDRAMKEGGMIMDDVYEGDQGELDSYNAVSLTDEDMMKLMEEEMRLEELEEELDMRLEGLEEESEMEEEKQEGQRRRNDELETSRQQSQPSWGETTIVGTNSVRDTPPSRVDSSSKKTFQKQDPNPFQKNYQTTPLADMLKDDTKGRSSRRQRPPLVDRTPLSAEPPHSFGRSRRQNSAQHRQNSVQMGTVIGGESSGVPKMKESKSLTDILKGSERRKTPQSRSATPPPPSYQQKTRSRATTPPPGGPKWQERPPRSKTFKTSSSRIDDSFRPNKAGGDGRGTSNNSRGYNTSWDNNNGPTMMNNSRNNGGPKMTNNSRSSVAAAGYSTSWDGPRPHDATSSSNSSGSGANSRAKNTQRPFEPAPFTEPGTHNQGSSSRTSPKRVPPSTPFTSPVSDGARRTSTSSQGPFTTTSSQGPFSPFTPPGRRSTNGKPPPQKRPSDPRGFNIKDTPETTQPFAGSQYYVDRNTQSYSPPLQVEAPPRDPNYVPPERPFEPAPFMNPQPHSVRGAGTSTSGAAWDKWNRVPPNAPNNGNANANNSGGSRRHQYQQQNQQNNQSQQTRNKSDKSQKRTTSSSSPFDNLKDIFSNLKNKKRKKQQQQQEDEAVKKEESTGFKSGNVEVFSSSNDDDNDNDDDDDEIWKEGRYRQDQIRREQQANIVEVEIIDAETMSMMEEEITTTTDADYWEQGDDGGGEEGDAWTGGPQPSQSSTPTTSSSYTSNDSDNYTHNDINIGEENNNDDAILLQKAQQLLATNPKIRSIVTQAQSNPRIRQAVQECMGNPTKFGLYLNDEEVGPILNELRECILFRRKEREREFEE